MSAQPREPAAGSFAKAAGPRRNPTENERARERVVLTSLSLDICLFVAIVVTAAASHSLTLLTEVLRYAGLFVGQIISIVALFAVHRARFGRLQYGFGKIEMLCNLMGCTALVIGGLWIVDSVLHVLFDGGAASRPVDLALAAVVATAGVAVNALVLVAMKAAWTPETSAIFIGKFRARQAKFLASLSAAVALTLSALAQDPAVGQVIDAAGAVAGVAAMMTVGIDLGSRCLCSLADMAAPLELRTRVERTLAEAGLGPSEGMVLRTRRSGRFTQLEVELTGWTGSSVGDLRRRGAAIERALTAAFRDAFDVSVVLRPQ